MVIEKQSKPSKNQQVSLAVTIMVSGQLAALDSSIFLPYLLS